MTQSQLAESLGVTFVTVSRWETGQARPNRLALKALSSLAKTVPEIGPPGGATAGRFEIREPQAPYEPFSAVPIPDFRTESETVRLFVEGERLCYGHIFSPTFGVETALIDPVPHQIIAVYHHMLSQPRLRFLLADDAGAGKTIMTGLYVREMLSRRLIRRVLIVPPAGLVGNWKRELHTLFSLQLREVTGPDCRVDNPFSGIGSDLA
ncbi:MAG: helix-turn-helix domain-containing protein, partial [Chloroflexi bacterium]|nr:helix-turn-helix domain-containing protein [Chloroflexota bacterium]